MPGHSKSIFVLQWRSGNPNSTLLLARGPFVEGRLHAWNTIAIPLASWFFIDTVFSIAHGVWGNVLLNTAAGLMFGIPLLFSRRYFRSEN